MSSQFPISPAEHRDPLSKDRLKELVPLKYANGAMGNLISWAPFIGLVILAGIFHQFILGALVGLGSIFVIGLIGALMTYIVSNKNFRDAIKIQLDARMLKFHDETVEQWKFEVAQLRINDFEGMRDNIVAQAKKLQGAVSTIERERDEQIAAKDKHTAEYELAMRKNMPQQARNAEFAAGEYLGAIKDSESRLAQVQGAKQLVQAQLELFEANLNKMKIKFEVACRKFRINTITVEAIQAAQGLMNSAQRKEFDQAMGFILSDIDVMQGQIQYFTDVTKPLVEQQQFESEAEREAAIQRFRQAMTDNSEIVPEDMQQRLLEQANVAVGATPVPMTAIPLGEKETLYLPAQQPPQSKYRLS